MVGSCEVVDVMVVCCCEVKMCSVFGASQSFVQHLIDSGPTTRRLG